MHILFITAMIFLLVDVFLFFLAPSLLFGVFLVLVRSCLFLVRKAGNRSLLRVLILCYASS
jgi:hypothetical protein